MTAATPGPQSSTDSKPWRRCEWAVVPRDGVARFTTSVRSPGSGPARSRSQASLGTVEDVTSAVPSSTTGSMTVCADVDGSTRLTDGPDLLARPAEMQRNLQRGRLGYSVPRQERAQEQIRERAAVGAQLVLALICAYFA
jgi:hypothetical protein